jgi:phage antirepressor YoqD-like protein
MARTEAQARAEKRYAEKRPLLAVRTPDAELYDAVVSASTEAGLTKAEWLRRAIAAQLERDNPKE